MLPLEEAIVEKLRKDGPCCFDDVVLHLFPFYSWEEVFLAQGGNDSSTTICKMPSVANRRQVM